MAQMKLVYTTRARLDELPLENGQIIYAPDDNLMDEVRNLPKINFYTGILDTDHNGIDDRKE